MPCYHPSVAYQKDDGSITFKQGRNIRREVTLPCGRCIGCRVKRTQAWSLRCVHESQTHKHNSFVTLTYDDDHYKPSLNYSDFQLFLKRLREHRFRLALEKYGDPKIARDKSGVRFFMCGEYGEDRSRPHFHALLFGVGFKNDGMCGKSIYRSRELESLWKEGFSSIGEVNQTTAAYVASYHIKKRSASFNGGDYYKRVNLQTGEIVDVTPEFGRMSLRPGIGATWFDRYWTDVYLARDGVVSKGKTYSAPRYYDTLLDRLGNDLPDIKEYDRYIANLKRADDNTEERLMVREIVAIAKERQSLRRSL